ncbi:MAG TPA: acylphosphatase [Acidimicrobiales bacterium]|nr:acylphosphatase [Acidimicrobiales bacterium]
MAQVRRRLIVRGRVQGVFYRASCAREAQRLGVAGWARNRPDGSVEVVAEGDAAAVDQLTAWCRRGPSRAQVDDVEVVDEPVAGGRGFTVR